MIVGVRARVAHLTLGTITNFEIRERLLIGDSGQSDSLLRAGLREQLGKFVRLTLLASLLHKTRRGRIQKVLAPVLMTKLLPVDVRDRGRQPRDLAQACVERRVQVRLRWLHLEREKQSLPSTHERLKTRVDRDRASPSWHVPRDPSSNHHAGTLGKP